MARYCGLDGSWAGDVAGGGSEAGAELVFAAALSEAGADAGGAEFRDAACGGTGSVVIALSGLSR